MHTCKILTWTPHLDSIKSNLLDNHKLLHFNNPTTNVILLLAQSQQRISHIHRQYQVECRIILVCTVNEYKQTFNMDPSSELHRIQPTGQPQVTSFQQSYYGYNSVTHSQLIEEKSHPQMVPGRIILVCVYTVHEYKQILTWINHLDFIESNLLDNHKLLHFNNPTTHKIILVTHGQQKRSHIHRPYQIESSWYVLFMNTSKILTQTPHLDSIESNLPDNHKLIHFNNPTMDVILLFTHGQQLEEKSHPQTTDSTRYNYPGMYCCS